MDYYTTGEVWDGIEAKEIGLTDEIGTLDTVVAGFGAPMHDFGPSSAGAGWLRGMATAMELLSRIPAR